MESQYERPLVSIVRSQRRKNRRALGQHYLVDGEAIGTIVSLAGVREGERVLEIGTGKGVLTEALARVSTRLDGYEVDEENLEATRQAVRGMGVGLHLGDVFEKAPRFDVLVASLPYSRSSSFVEWISKQRYDRAVVVLQEDFVTKVNAPPGHRDYRAVSVIAQASTDIRLAGRIPRSSFVPQPRVNSVVVTLKPTRVLTTQQILWVKKLFALRRRQLGAAMAKLGDVSPKGLATRRVFTLHPDQVLALASYIGG